MLAYDEGHISTKLIEPMNGRAVALNSGLSFSTYHRAAMSHFMLSCEKTQTMQTMREIIASVPNENDICVHTGMDYEDYQTLDDEDTPPTIVAATHNISLVEFECVDLAFDGKSCHLVEMDDFFGEDVHWTETTAIEIHHGTTIHDGTIRVEGYFHESEFECDVCVLKFAYNERHQCWICVDADCVLNFNETLAKQQDQDNA